MKNRIKINKEKLMQLLQEPRRQKKPGCLDVCDESIVPVVGTYDEAVKEINNALLGIVKEGK